MTITRATTGEQWAVRVVALLPVLLVAVGCQEVVGATPTIAILLPAAIVTALLSAAFGHWVGLVGVVGAGVVALIVTTPVPANALAALAVAVAGATWLSQVLVSSRRPALAIIPPVVLFFPELILGLAGSGGSVILTAGIAVSLALLLLVTGSWSGAGEGPAAAVAPASLALAWSAFAMVFVGVVALAAGLIADSILGPPHRVADLTPTPPPPSVVVDVRDPLTEATRWQLSPSEASRELMTLLPPVHESRPVWLSLADYNGTGWVIPVFYVGVSGQVPPDPVVNPTSAVTDGVRVEVGAGLPGPWVPVPQRVTQVIGASPVRVNARSGIIASDTTPIGQAFDVRYRQGTATDEQLGRAKPAVAPGDSSQQLPSALPPEMAQLSKSVAASAGKSTWGRLVGLSNRLRGDSYFAAQASELPLSGPGRTLTDLNRVLADGRGFQEQYAEIFALTARSWGVPTRVCIGFLPHIRTAATVVHGPDTSIWAEARLAGIGWVAFQPSPQDREAGRPAVVRPPQPKPTPKPTPSPTSTSNGSPAPTSTSSDAAGGANRQGTARLFPWILIPLLLAIWPVWVAVRRRRNRQRLASGSPHSRAVGAWLWGRQALDDAGLALPASASPDRVADSADPVCDDVPPSVVGPLRLLAARCVPALYAPAAISVAEADAAWQAADEVVHAAGRTLTPGRRIRRWLVAVPPVTARSEDPATAGTLSETAVGRAPRGS